MTAPEVAEALFWQIMNSLNQHLLQSNEFLGFFGNFLALVAYFRKTMIPLRLFAICSNIVLIIFGYWSSSYPTLFTNVILLPLNIDRLLEMRRLVRRVETAASGDFSADWLTPFMTKHKVAAGTLLFSRDDTADSLFLVVSGRFLLEEIGIDILPGTIVGELGMLSPSRKRTQSLRCVEAGEILSITYSHVEQLYFQNPEFGFFFLQLASKRLFHNLELMEQRIGALPPVQREPAGSDEMQAVR